MKLETAALTAELDRPDDARAPGISKDLAHTLAAQVAEIRRRSQSEVQARLQSRGLSVTGRIRAWFLAKRQELQDIFRSEGVGDAVVQSFSGMPPNDSAKWFRRQVSDSSHRAGHYADFNAFSAWINLRIAVSGWRLRYVASVHGAGRDPGVLAVTTFGEIEEMEEASSKDGLPEAHADIHQGALPIVTTNDAFTFVHTEEPADIDARSHELESLLDEGLTEALAQLLKRI